MDDAVKNHWNSQKRQRERELYNERRQRLVVAASKGKEALDAALAAEKRNASGPPPAKRAKAPPAKPAKAARPKKPRATTYVRTAKQPWSAEDDVMLSDLVAEYGRESWAHVASQFTLAVSGGDVEAVRTGKQCRERWLSHLHPHLKRGPWTKNEEKVLAGAVARFGKRWAEIARMLPGRSDNMVKNHWHSRKRVALAKLQRSTS